MLNEIMHSEISSEPKLSQMSNNGDKPDSGNNKTSQRRFRDVHNFWRSMGRQLL